MKWLKGLRSSFRKQMIFTAFLCLLIPVGGIMLFSSSLTINLIKGRVVHTASESLQVTQLHISNVMSNLIRITNNIQFDRDIGSILRYPPSQGSKAAIDMQKLVEEKINSFTSENTGIYVTILLSNDTYYTNYNYYDFHPLRFKDEPWFSNLQMADSFETYWLGVQPTYIQSERSRNPYVITVARTLRDISSKPYAYVIVSVNELQLRSIIEQYSDSQSIMLLSDQGVILSGMNHIGERYPHFKDWNQLGDVTILNIGEEKQIVVTKNLSFAGWKLVSLTPYKNVTSQVNTIFRSNFLLESVFVVLFLIIFVYLLRRFTKPVVRLVQIASNIEAGKLSIRSNIKGPDEFVKLGRSFDTMLDSIELMISQITHEQAMKRKAELAMLQAQINPHFLFNILNALRMRIMLKGDRENANIISSLSRLLRQTINHDLEFIVLNEEVHLVEDYMKLMRFTFKYPFQYEIKLSSESLLEPVPRFILQPIIENCLIHGLKQREGKITIHAWKMQEKFVLVIQDDGAGMTVMELEGLRNKLQLGFENGMARTETRKGMSGIGLVNVHERLKLVYGERFRMELESEPGKGTVVKLIIRKGEIESHVEGSARG
ncbi:sensor histidine kinase [Paenibacillus thalictri]|uniref:Sensor histidine kinase n=1 Tax=Paenibacillus thalictri TaxID=2527873 RepID=A0A4Q9DMM9_9BACL|nr:sensor histidine kinase [Paenibacillus thalictri]TBL76582.1 sensor histidine kinase [Paenibacillus thalictri]